MIDPETIAWRDTMQPVRLFVFDARLLVFLAVWVLWPTWWTTGALVLALVAFRVAEAGGYRLRAALCGLRARSAGRRRALHARRYARLVDYG